MIFDVYLRALERNAKQAPFVRTMLRQLRTCCLIDMRGFVPQYDEETFDVAGRLESMYSRFFLPFPKESHWLESDGVAAMITPLSPKEQASVAAAAQRGNIVKEGVVSSLDTSPTTLDWSEPGGLEGRGILFQNLSIEDEPAELILRTCALLYVRFTDSTGIKKVRPIADGLQGARFDPRTGRLIDKVALGAYDDGASDLAHHLSDAAAHSFVALDDFNSPANLVIRRQRPGGAIRALPKIAMRSNQRPRYIVLPRKEAVRFMRQDLPEAERRRLKGGHPRRRHWRTLRAERFRHKRGKRIVVKECWVGPRTIIREGVQYTVLPELMGHDGGTTERQTCVPSS